MFYAKIFFDGTMAVSIQRKTNISISFKQYIIYNQNLNFFVASNVKIGTLILHENVNTNLNISNFLRKSLNFFCVSQKVSKISNKIRTQVSLVFISLSETLLTLKIGALLLHKKVITSAKNNLLNYFIITKTFKVLSTCLHIFF